MTPKVRVRTSYESLNVVGLNALYGIRCCDVIIPTPGTSLDLYILLVRAAVLELLEEELEPRVQRFECVDHPDRLNRPDRYTTKYNSGDEPGDVPRHPCELS